jgi:hypothetical protein
MCTAGGDEKIGGEEAKSDGGDVGDPLGDGVTDWWMGCGGGWVMMVDGLW